jgi:glucose-6-phosphate isomerase
MIIVGNHWWFMPVTISQKITWLIFLKLLDQRDYALTVISKSGTTTEPAIAFRILRKHLEDKYGKEEARKRIIAITDQSKGALKTPCHF